MSINQEQQTAIISRSARRVTDAVTLRRKNRKRVVVRFGNRVNGAQEKLALAIVSAAIAELFEMMNSFEAKLEKLRATQIDWLKPIRRWTDRRKAEILGAIAAGRVTETDALSSYSLCVAELDRWRERLGHDGGYVGRCYGRDGSDRMYR